MQVVKPVVRVIFGRNHWIIKHLQNDWLAGMWIFYVATLFCLIATGLLFLYALAYGTNEELFIYGVGYTLEFWIIIYFRLLYIYFFSEF